MNTESGAGREGVKAALLFLIRKSMTRKERETYVVLETIVCLFEALLTMLSLEKAS